MFINFRTLGPKYGIFPDLFLPGNRTEVTSTASEVMSSGLALGFRVRVVPKRLQRCGLVGSRWSLRKCPYARLLSLEFYCGWEYRRGFVPRGIPVR